MYTPRSDTVNPHKLQLELNELTPAELRYAEYTLGETSDRCVAAMDAFRHMIDHDGTLDVPLTDQFLLRFMRPTKFYPFSAFKMLRGALKFKQLNAEALDKITVTNEEDSFLSGGSVNILAQRDSRGRRVLLLNVVSNLSAQDAKKIFRMMYLMHQAVSLEPRTQIFGIVVIINFNTVGAGNMSLWRFSFVRKLLSFFKGASAVRLKEIHIIREPIVYNCLWKFTNLFIDEKIRKRTYLHGKNMEGLHKHMSRSTLPLDLGGLLPRLDYSSADWYPVLKTVEPTLKEWTNCEIRALSDTN